MTEFQPGDQVRVRVLPTTGKYAGRTGELASVTPDPVTGVARICHVRFSRNSVVCALFSPNELEPETASPP